MKTVEAVIEPNGEVHLVEPMNVSSPRRALVTILEEAPTVHDAALLSEAALAEDWNRARRTPHGHICSRPSRHSSLPFFRPHRV